MAADLHKEYPHGLGITPFVDNEQMFACECVGIISVIYIYIYIYRS